MKREVARLLSLARAQGATVRQTRNGHWQVLVPGGGIVVTGSTPSDHRAVKNFAAQLRRAGLTV